MPEIEIRGLDAIDSSANVLDGTAGHCHLVCHPPRHRFDHPSYSRPTLSPRGFLFRQRPIENDGQLYLTFFRIKRWKDYAPDGADFSRNRGFPKKKLKETGNRYLHKFFIDAAVFLHLAGGPPPTNRQSAFSLW